MYKQDLALNDQEGLIYYRKPEQPTKQPKGIHL